MEITNNITVPLSVDDAWAMLTDLERIAPCMPGAKLTGRDGDNYLGTVRIKIGPITSLYSGVARFISQDPISHEATIEAEARDTKASGTAKALVHARLRGESGSTRVEVVTDLAISGKVAQFGRGVIADVSEKLMEQFSQNLAAQLGTAMADEPPVTVDSSTKSDQVLDLGQMALPKDKARILGLVLGALLVLVVLRSRRWH